MQREPIFQGDGRYICEDNNGKKVFIEKARGFGLTKINCYCPDCPHTECIYHDRHTGQHKKMPKVYLMKFGR